MNRISATRRHAVMALVSIWMLVLIGYGYGTWAAIQLDRDRAREAGSKDYDELRALALTRMEQIIEGVLYRESVRPFTEYQRYYRPLQVFHSSGGEIIDDKIYLESPLAAELPSHVLLHFQATETGREPTWESPQIPEDEQTALPVWTLPEEARTRIATPANWLATLRDRFTPSYLLNELETAVINRNSSLLLLADAAPLIHDATPPAAGPERDRERFDPELSRTSKEFARRGAKLLEMRRQADVEVCVPETVLIENLKLDSSEVPPEAQSPGCLLLSYNLMTPLWLNLTDDEMQLVLMRTVVVAGIDHCLLQGVVLDWKGLHEELQETVRDLFPDAAIKPVSTDEPITRGMTETMLQSIPARFVPGEAAMPTMAAMSSTLKVGLIAALITTLLALLAVSYGTIKYVALMERRMQFVAAVTHELRTPLTSFQLYTDLLAEMPDLDADQRRHHVTALRKESRRLTRLVENVLAYARIEDSRASLNVRTVEPGALLENVREAMADACEAGGKELIIDNRCKSDTRCETDPEVVSQILTNLVENACKYSAGGEDSRVWLTASDEGGGITFAVDDTGPGIAPHDRRVIFEPFRRSSSVTGQGGPSGLGLGLALSRYWASCLGGKLSLGRSEHNGAYYSRFALTLPADVAA